MELLTRAVESLKAGREPNLDAPLNAGVDINLHIPALLPEDYVPDVHLRLILYKRIASAGSEGDLRELQVELIDRFGLLPQPARNLMRIASIKLRAAALGIEKIDAAEAGGYLQFVDQPSVDPLAVVRLVQAEGRIYRMQGAHRLQFRKDLGNLEARFAEIDSLLEQLAGDGGATRAMTG